MGFYRTNAIKVKQRFGDFYVASIPASKLVSVCYSFPATYFDGALSGIQRSINDKRVNEISAFCATDSMFPGSIILSVNILPSGSVVDPEDQWYLEGESVLVIPSDISIASIIDGQHRWEGIKKALDHGVEDFDLACVIYFGLPAPKQAEIFSVINFNQKSVDKSLAYQLFGYDLSESDSKYWSPDTLAIYIARLLDSEKDSPLQKRISFGMEKRDTSTAEEEKAKWKISTAVVVDGICGLITKDATRDRYTLHKKRIIKKGREILSVENDNSPLREFYVGYKDRAIYDLLLCYFVEIDNCILKKNAPALMYKTIAFQAYFDLLKAILKYEAAGGRDFSKMKFYQYFEKVDLDTLGELEVNYSGAGRVMIRKELERQVFAVASGT